MKWLPPALVNVERLHEFLQAKSPTAANKAVECLLQAADQIERMPEIGRPMRDDTGCRELAMPFGGGASVLRYRLDESGINNCGAPVIVRVWHARENREV